MAGITQGKRVAILGATGRIGRMFCDLGPGLAPDLTLVPVAGRSAPGFVVWAPGEPVPEALRCDVVLALWGVTTAHADGHGANADLAHAAMAFAGETGARRVVQCSTGAVYPPGAGPFRETDALDPATPYGLSKQDMERVIAEHPGTAQNVILRIGNVAGADSLFLAGARDGKITLDQFADGSGPRRSYIGPSALVRVLIWAATAKAPPAIVNVAAPDPVSMSDLARHMDWPVTMRPAPEGARPLVALDTDRLTQHCPLPPEASDPRVMAEEVHAGGWHL